MRKIIVISMITLDGVMQAPGGPKEDTSGDFQYGGWVAPYGDKIAGEVMKDLMKPSDLLLGRTTFEIWEAYWPQHQNGWPGINDVTKYVLSTTRNNSSWQNAVFLNSLTAIETLKNSEGSDIQVWGSSQLVQLLFQHNLVDELWLLIHPLTLGKGKKLFTDSATPGAFTLVANAVSVNGVIMAHYKRAGNVQTGTTGE